MSNSPRSDPTWRLSRFRESIGWILVLSYLAIAGGSVWLQIGYGQANAALVHHADQWLEGARGCADLSHLLSQLYAVAAVPGSSPSRVQRFESLQKNVSQSLASLNGAVAASPDVPAKAVLGAQFRILQESVSALESSARKTLEGSSVPELEAAGPNAPQVEQEFERAAGALAQIHHRLGNLAHEQGIRHWEGMGRTVYLEVVLQGLLLVTIGGMTLFLYRMARRMRRDVHERLSLAEKLRAGDVRYRSIFDNAVEGIFQATPEGRFLTVNRALAEMCGYPSPEALVESATNLGTQFYVNPTQRETLLQTLQVQDVVSNFQFELVRPDGRSVWLRENVRAVRDEQGALLYLEGTAEDISERWWAERRRSIQFATTRILNEATSVAEARPRVMQSICTLLQWDLAVNWEVEPVTRRLQAGDTWHNPEATAEGFDWVTALAACRLGAGLTGETWQNGEPNWIPDLAEISGGVPFREAVRVGVQSTVWVPVKVNGVVLHVLEFFSRRKAAPDGELLGTLGTVGEQIAQLLEREQTEEALRKSEMRKAAILRSAFDCIVSFDRDGRITEFNPAAEQTFGYAAAEVLGREMIDLLIPETRRGVHRRGLDIYNASSENQLLKRRRLELQAVRSDGSQFPVEVAVSRMKIDGKAMFTAFLRDLSERRDAERITAELAAVVANSNDAIIACTLEGMIRSWNAGAERIYGYAAEEVLGRPLEMFFPPDRLDELPQMLGAVQKGQSLANYETVRLRKDGKKISVSLTDSPIRSEAGLVTGLSSIARDITERKRLEEDLLQSQKMDAVGRLAGGIAHDFNNVLTAILGYSDLIIGQIDERQWLYKYLIEIRKAADFASALTHQLLAFSRRQPLYLRVFNINDSVRSMQQMLQRVIGEQVEFVTTLKAESGRLKADPSQIEQVLLNLCVNARDAMSNGGTITITTEDVSYFLDDFYSVPEMPAGEYVKLTVSDNGSGMTPEIIKHIFEPFFTTKEEGQGTGLGLATCYGIVKQSGGYLNVDSAPGLGTTFSVYLPRVDEGGQKTPLRNEAGQLPSGSETILYVEDEITVRSLTAHVLRGLGYTVLEAGDGQGARELVEGLNGQTIDLLFSDVVLPDDGGKAIADWIELRNPGTKILFTSGYVDESILRRHGLDAESPFLQKPFSPSDLARKVRAVMDDSTRLPNPAPPLN